MYTVDAVQPHDPAGALRGRSIAGITPRRPGPEGSGFPRPALTASFGSSVDSNASATFPKTYHMPQENESQSQKQGRCAPARSPKAFRTFFSIIGSFSLARSRAHCCHSAWRFHLPRQLRPFCRQWGICGQAVRASFPVASGRAVCAIRRKRAGHIRQHSLRQHSLRLSLKLPLPPRRMP